MRNDYSKWKIGTRVMLNQQYMHLKAGAKGTVAYIEEALEGLTHESLIGVNYDDGSYHSCYAHRLDCADVQVALLDGRQFRGHSSAALRKVRTILRMKGKGLSVRAIADKLELSKSAVHRVLQRAA